MWHSVALQFMGTVVDVGTAVNDINVGDRVVCAFDIGCGRCFFCKKVRLARMQPLHERAASYIHAGTEMV